MTATDWIGFIGVAILLIAFFLNIANIIKSDSFLYLFLNLVGAGISCTASIMLKYIPFVIMEACWTMVSALGLVRYARKK
ncbi:MAG TPA: hypothetical protein VK559_07595 [Ferruginibacter sp.]|nr:hypothetical protein [Ferruginibacter sp.]